MAITTNPNYKIDFISALALDHRMSSTFSTMEKYKKFCKVTKGPVDKDQFYAMLNLEIENLKKREKTFRSYEKGRDVYHEDDLAKRAVEIMQSWYLEALDQDISDLVAFIANTRTACVWATLLRISHEPDFKMIAWLAGRLYGKNKF